MTTTASDALAMRQPALTYSREQFDDYLVALLARIRFDDEADRLLSGESSHPLILYQRQHANALNQLKVLPFTAPQLIEDPIGCYIQFTRSLGEALSVFPGNVPDVGNLTMLDDLYQIHRKAQRFVYDTIVRTLKVGSSMHYARGVKFGAGVHLLNILISDNRQTTTRSLMALFSTLLSLELKASEMFESFARRMDQLIQRLRNWQPPVVLPDQLLLYCALRALPEVPYGPVRHIILASPHIGYRTGMQMLKDVANTGAELIKTTLGSSSESKPAAVLCAPQLCDEPKRSQQSHRAPKQKKKRGPSKLCIKEGPCKHHGPKSFHATSECRDPTLSRRKTKPAPSPSASASKATPLAAVATTSSTDTSILYSPIFVTKISKASVAYPRARFRPRRNLDAHFRRGRAARRKHSRTYNVDNISQAVLDNCILAYTQPIRGSLTRSGVTSRHQCHSSSAQKKKPKRRSRRQRRRYRRKLNAFNNYPGGVFTPSHRRSSPVARPSWNRKSTKPLPVYTPAPRSKCSMSMPLHAISSNEVAHPNFRSGHLRASGCAPSATHPSQTRRSRPKARRSKPSRKAHATHPRVVTFPRATQTTASPHAASIPLPTAPPIPRFN